MDDNQLAHKTQIYKTEKSFCLQDDKETAKTDKNKKAV